LAALATNHVFTPSIEGWIHGVENRVQIIAEFSERKGTTCERVVRAATRAASADSSPAVPRNTLRTPPPMATFEKPVAHQAQ
jgi:hypothetical protein